LYGLTPLLVATTSSGFVILEPLSATHFRQSTDIRTMESAAPTLENSAAAN